MEVALCPLKKGLRCFVSVLGSANIRLGKVVRKNQRTSEGKRKDLVILDSRRELEDR